MTNPKKVSCKNCKTPIYRSTGRFNENLKFGWNFYCSRKCEYQYKTKKQILMCENCGKVFGRTPKEISPHNYCSQSCAAIVNNKRYPKRHLKPRFKICAQCNKEFSKSIYNKKYCSLECRKEAEWHTREKLLTIIKNIAQKLGRVPSRRETGGIDKSCRKFFGTWNKAIIAAGFSPNRSHSQRMYKRVNAIAKDGHLCDSISETIVDDWLAKNKIPHERNINYPNAHHKADWGIKLENQVIFVEYFGLADDSPRYDRAIKEKIDICNKNYLNLIPIYPNDLYPKERLDANLKEKFKKLL